MNLRIYSREQSEEISVQAWELLAQRALVKNPFYEHWNLLPALQHLQKNDKVDVVTAWSEGQLLALFPLCYRWRNPAFTMAEVWKHEECFCTSPLITDERVWSELLPLLWHASRVHMLINSTQVENALIPNNALCLTRTSYQRAALDCSRSFKSMEDRWSRKRRKNWRRLMRKMFENGYARYYSQHTPVACQNVFSKYQQIESSGWKGRAGTAIANSVSTRRYYESMITEGAQHGRVETQLLEFKGQALAASIRLKCGDRAFEVKTSYSEAHRKMSPGVMLEILNMQQLACSDIGVADSCTQAGNRLIESLWRDTIPVYNSVYFAQGLRAKISWLVVTLQRRLKHGSLSSHHQKQIGPKA